MAQEILASFLGQAQYGLERTDVGNAFGNANYNLSGYSFSFDASSLEQGSSHKIIYLCIFSQWDSSIPYKKYHN